VIDLRELEALEARWKEPGDSPLLPDAYGFQAFRIPDFLRLLAVAVMAVAPMRSFLDAGCGIGTKVLIARDMFGLDAAGIDVVPSYVEEAGRLGLGGMVALVDVREFGGYGEQDIVYCYGPFREPDAQAAFEKRLHAAMRPGSILIAVMPTLKPRGWECLFRVPWQGVWRKPTERG